MVVVRHQPESNSEDRKMDTKPRILIVEDDPNFRKSLINGFTRAGFRADAAATVAEAKSLIGLCSYHVALIDIMLDGNATSNREGIEVIKYLRWLREDTQPLVLSGQDDIPLVRDLLRKYGAVDYVAKKEVLEKGKGFAFLLEQVTTYLAGIDSHAEAKDWRELSDILSGGLSEQIFVNECLRSMKFNGGFENLRASLVTACRHLRPLLPPNGESTGVRPKPSSQVLSSVFWSRGQGTAVEIIMYGIRIPEEDLEAELKLSERTTLFNRTKGGLTIVVVQRTDMHRDQFRPMPG
jgi:CheY-like chemotaxis protein